MRILALDIGQKRIGIAVSDPFGWTAQGVATLARKNEKKDIAAILSYCRELEVGGVIVCIPLDAEGEMGPEAQRIERFRARLVDALAEAGMALPVEGWDERFSTRDAEERLLEADVSRAKRRRVIDKMAAVVILESYLRDHKD